MYFMCIYIIYVYIHIYIYICKYTHIHVQSYYICTYYWKQVRASHKMHAGVYMYIMYICICLLLMDTSQGRTSNAWVQAPLALASGSPHLSKERSTFVIWAASEFRLKHGRIRNPPKAFRI